MRCRFLASGAPEFSILRQLIASTRRRRLWMLRPTSMHRSLNFTATLASFALAKLVGSNARFVLAKLVSPSARFALAKLVSSKARFALAKPGRPITPKPTFQDSQ
jgi:hypothetical protein